jgi:hypothetical protein
VSVTARPGSWRRLAAAVTVLASLPATEGRATFDLPSEVVLGTAQTLEQGELMIGILSPIAYGINDSLTLFIHPISLALLTPNGAFRWRLVDAESWRIAAAFGGAVTVPVDGVVDDDPRRPLGHADAGLLATTNLGPWVLTARAGYRHDFGPADDDFDWGVVVDWVISPSSLLQVQGGFLVGRERGLKSPSATISYVHSWGQVNLAVGVAYGEFPLALEANAVPKCTTGSWSYPCLWPVADVFWRF